MTAESLAHSLDARRNGSGWMARCAAHDDRNPSMSIKAGFDGQVLIHCHAGCHQADVIDALRSRGLWDFGEEQIVRRIVATYDYTDETGGLLYQVVRYEPKDFRQRRPDGRGGWIWKKSPRQVLYRLPEVLKAPIVFVVEGEKDVATLEDWGFVATTTAGGAKAQWLPEYSEALRGRQIILLPDSDEPGRARILQICMALRDNASRIVIIEFEDAKDVTEWFGRGHSELELIALVEGPNQ